MIGLLHHMEVAKVIGLLDHLDVMQQGDRAFASLEVHEGDRVSALHGVRGCDWSFTSLGVQLSNWFAWENHIVVEIKGKIWR